jgi:hypothetical protein
MISHLVLHCMSKLYDSFTCWPMAREPNMREGSVTPSAEMQSLSDLPRIAVDLL